MPRGVNARLEQVMRAQRDEPVGLDPPAALQHLLHRRASGCRSGSVANTPPNHSNACTCASKNACWVSRRERHARSRAREARAHQEQMHRRRHAGEHHRRLAPVDLRLHPRLVAPAARTPRDRPPQLTPPRAHILAHRAARDTSAPCSSTSRSPDPPRGVPLLARRLPVSLKPRVDQRPIRAQASAPADPPAACARRHRRLQRLAHRPPMHPIPRRQRAHRQPLPIAVPPDLLEQLHSGTHPFCDLPRARETRTLGHDRTEGGAKSSLRTGAKSGRRSHRWVGRSARLTARLQGWCRTTQ